MIPWTWRIYLVLVGLLALAAVGGVFAFVGINGYTIVSMLIACSGSVCG